MLRAFAPVFGSRRGVWLTGSLCWRCAVGHKQDARARSRGSRAVSADKKVRGGGGEESEGTGCPLGARSGFMGFRSCPSTGAALSVEPVLCCCRVDSLVVWGGGAIGVGVLVGAAL